MQEFHLDLCQRIRCCIVVPSVSGFILGETCFPLEISKSLFSLSKTCVCKSCYIDPMLVQFFLIDGLAPKRRNSVTGVMSRLC